MARACCRGRWSAAESRRVAAGGAVYLALLSRARDDDGQPLLHIEVQLWVRELHRMLRAVAPPPEFAWWSDAQDPEKLTFPPPTAATAAGPGWAAVAGELPGHCAATPKTCGVLGSEPGLAARPARSQPGRARCWLA